WRTTFGTAGCKVSPLYTPFFAGATKFATVLRASDGKNSIRISPPFSSVMTPVGFMLWPSLGDDPHRLHAVADLDPVHDVHAAHDPAEGGVLAVQALVVAQHAEIMASGGVW